MAPELMSTLRHHARDAVTRNVPPPPRVGIHLVRVGRQEEQFQPPFCGCKELIYLDRFVRQTAVGDQEEGPLDGVEFPLAEFDEAGGRHPPGSADRRTD